LQLRDNGPIFVVIRVKYPKLATLSHTVDRNSIRGNNLWMLDVVHGSDSRRTDLVGCHEAQFELAVIL
jgi:hypothetical protein